MVGRLRDRSSRQVGPWVPDGTAAGTHELTGIIGVSSATLFLQTLIGAPTIPVLRLRDVLEEALSAKALALSAARIAESDRGRRLYQASQSLTDCCPIPRRD